MTGSTEPKPLAVALLGCGSVGSAVARLLHEHADDLAARVGRPLELAGVAVRRPDLPRDVPVDPALFTSDTKGLASRDDIDIVVEVIGGIEPTREILITAMRNGASVVTANKALLAEDAGTLFATAEDSGVDLYFEAAVAGAIPLIRPLRESMAGDRVSRVIGIVNGTTNYILDRMDSEGTSFAEALDEAQQLGYAEPDPTADVAGFDAAAKAAILAGLAFHTRVTMGEVYREGISEVTQQDVSAAREMGCVVKLLAICDRHPDGEHVGVRVHPAMIPRSHPLASVRGAYNAVFVESAAAGRLMFYGQGAGGAPTAGAVLGDLVTVARNRVQNVRGPGESAYAELAVHSMGDTLTRYHVALDVDDRTGVLARVAEVFSAGGVSIQTVRQEGRGEDAKLVIVTHQAPDAALAATVQQLTELPAVRAVSSVLRVESE